VVISAWPWCIFP